MTQRSKVSPAGQPPVQPRPTASRRPMSTSAWMATGSSLLLACDGCPVRETHCADCVVTALLAQDREQPTPRPVAVDAPSAGMPLDRAERRAVSALISSGLISADTANTLRAVPDLVPQDVQRPGVLQLEVRESAAG
mgnify:CR=1 FL=1